MAMRYSHFTVPALAGVIAFSGFMITGERAAQASCGSASCFLAIGNQPGVQPKDLVRVDINYAYIPQTGPNNHVAAVNVERQRQILDEHFEQQTINQQLQLNVNYGVTDNLTLQFTLPVIFRNHDHIIEVGEDGTNPGEPENFSTDGLGDLTLMAKYGFLPTIRSLIVLGLGVDFPTGSFEARNSLGRVQEPTLQVGRGNYGIRAHAFQNYELIPHKLNQFLSYTYLHTFENKFDYQFGDTHLFAAGLNYLATTNITLSLQMNYEYRLQDEHRGSLRLAGPIALATGVEEVLDPNVAWRGVANTGSTSLLLTPGLTLNLTENLSWYFYGQAPLVQDFNGGLESGPNFLTGFVRFFTVGS